MHGGKKERPPLQVMSTPGSARARKIIEAKEMMAKTPSAKRDSISSELSSSRRALSSVPTPIGIVFGPQPVDLWQLAVGHVQHARLSSCIGIQEDETDGADYADLCH
jgi:hypothetical protein